MRIGLIGVDDHNYPNLPLMKLSAWHRKQGHKVEFALLLKEYDRVYMSKVFGFTPDENHSIAWVLRKRNEGKILWRFCRKRIVKSIESLI